MQISTLVFNVALLFIMMVPGFIMIKTRLCDEGFSKGISNLVLYIAQPALIIYSYIDFDGKFSDIWQNLLAVFFLSIFAHALFSVIALLFFRNAPDSKRRVLRFVTVFSNAAFMGIPLVQAILGSEFAIYASIYNITFNIFLWTFGVYLCTSGRCDEDEDSDAAHKGGPLKAAIRLIIHPVTLASIVGISLLAFGVNTKSFDLGLFEDSLFMLKNLVAPLSMLVIGLKIANVNFKQAFNDVYLYFFLFLRHFLLPLAVIIYIQILGVIGIPISDDAALVTVILAATPAATSAAMFAVKYDCDVEYTTRLVTISTLLSIATIPLMVWLISL